MAKIRNVSGEDRTVPWLGNRLVMAGQVVEVPEGDVYHYTQSVTWEPADSEAQAAHDDGASVYEPIAEAEADPALERPARNASRDEWVAYAVAAGYAADPESLDSVGRDEIRDNRTGEVS